MTKKKPDIKSIFLHFFTHHPWLKFISLVLAVIVWFYVRGEISRFNY
ncbi:hypothetical protein ACFL1K_02225 [Candidatus Omnitrophota bacterium]